MIDRKRTFMAFLDVLEVLSKGNNQATVFEVFFEDGESVNVEIEGWPERKKKFFLVPTGNDQDGSS